MPVIAQNIIDEHAAQWWRNYLNDPTRQFVVVNQITLPLRDNGTYIYLFTTNDKKAYRDRGIAERYYSRTLMRRMMRDAWETYGIPSKVFFWNTPQRQA